MRKLMLNALGMLKNFRNKEESLDSGLHLKSLRPTKDLLGHALYVKELSRAVENDEIQNIALTGSYGAGKSSILRDFAEDKKNKKTTLQISFSSLGANIQDYIKQDEKSEKYEKLNNLANLIQKEIVKQILFKEKTKNIPYSRFRRVTSPNVFLLLTASVIITTLIFSFIITNGWLGSLFDTLALHNYNLRIIEGAILYVTSICAVLLFLLTVGSKINISKIGNSTISLSLSEKNSYFDEYLDEIIYFFEAAKYRVVIFEDIDRFDNLYIFENLRQLNTILNNSKQIKKKVTFVYAVKDSIFSKEAIDEKSKNGDHKERSANRTKFFDIIIPVVPFITNISSRDLMLKEFDAEYQKELKEPVSIVSKYITDMRLVKNIYNEFLIFKQKVALENSGLSLGRLFAIVAYKNWNLDDFEKIKDGDSLINKALEARSEFIEIESSSLAVKINNKRNMVENINSVEARLSSLGGRLASYIDNTLSRIDSTLLSITLNGSRHKREDFMTLAFWEEVLSKGDDNTLIINYQPRRIGYTLSLTLNTADLRTITQNSLDASEWTKHDTEKLNSEIEELVAEQAELSYMDMKDLLSKYDNFHITLSNIADGKLSEDKLTWELIEAGYINDEFIHYTSIFHEYNMSLQARSFWLNNIRHNKVSMYHKFVDNNDVEALLEEVGTVYFRDKSMYNIQIVDYLLDKSDPRVSHIITNLSSGENEDLRFIDAYVKNGRKVDEFVKHLAHEWPEIFMHIVNHEEMDDKKKVYFISLALESGDRTMSYYYTEAVTKFIDQQSGNILILNKGKDDEKLETASVILDALNISFTSLDSLSDLAKRKVQDAQLYVINANNLQVVLGHPRLPLDEIRNVDRVAYNHILANLQAYIALYSDKTDDFMLAGRDGFEAVIDDVSKISLELLDAVVSKADSVNCKIEDMNKLSTSTWDILIKHILLSNSLSNVLSYFNFYNSKDENSDFINQELITYLNTTKAVTLDKDYEEFDHERVKSFIIAVINCNDIEDETKVGIAEKCYTKNYLDVDSLVKKEGSFFGKLVKRNIIADSAESFNYIRDLSWETKKAYIVNSDDFTDYIDELDITTEELDSLVTDDDISNKLKLYIINNILSYSDVMSTSITRRLADIAANDGLALDYESIKVLANGGNADSIIPLINASLSTLTLDDYVSILSLLGGEYKKLTQNSKRPSFPATDYNLTLITKLKALGAVSSYNTAERIKVVMKPKWR